MNELIELLKVKELYGEEAHQNGVIAIMVEEAEDEEKAKNAIRNYIPAVCIGLDAATCISAANTLNIKKQADIISASGSIANSFTTYKSKAKKELKKELIKKTLTIGYLRVALVYKTVRNYVFEKLMGH